jgi:hypothetical protein
VRDVNLVFLAHPRRGRTFADFEAVARRVAGAHPRIRARVLSTRNRVRTAAALLGIAGRPSLVVEMNRLVVGRPLRGKWLRHRPQDKIEELEALARAGIPVPRWRVLEPGTSLDPGEWGALVVRKPSWGGQGYNVELLRTAEVRYRRPEEYPEDHLGRLHPMIVQEFVYTGRYPESLRVLSYLGRPILALRFHDAPQAKALAGRDALDVDGHKIVASPDVARISFLDDPDALALAKRVHDSFPDIPSLGIDIVRDAETGRLFVTEINPQGASWHFADRTTLRQARIAGIDLYSQFDALSAIAEASADAALRLAR